MILARRPLIRQKIAPHRDGNAKILRVETRRRRQAAGLVLRMVRVGQVQTVPRLQIEPLERLAPCSPLCVIRGAGWVALALVVRPHYDQLVRARIRQRRQKRRPDDAEDGHVGPDPQRQRQNRDRRESLVAGQHAQPKTHIPIPVRHRSTPFSRHYAQQPSAVQRPACTLSPRANDSEVQFVSRDWRSQICWS